MSANPDHPFHVADASKPREMSRFPQIKALLWESYQKDRIILGSILGPPIYGNPHVGVWEFLQFWVLLGITCEGPRALQKPLSGPDEPTTRLGFTVCHVRLLMRPVFCFGLEAAPSWKLQVQQ